LSLSPQQNTVITEQQQHPLTKDALRKKDRLDLLLPSRPMPGVRRVKRRRSISNGNIYRHRYNEDNKPMTLAISGFKRSNSFIESDTSVKSPRSQYDTRTPHHHGHHYQPIAKKVVVISHHPSYSSSINKKQSTDSQPINTNRALDSDLWANNEPTNLMGPPRRFSSLVRLSAAHIAMKRTQKNKKLQHYRPTLFDIIYQKLSVVALRVVDSRTSEPSDTHMSIEELTSLSRYLGVLKSSQYNNQGNEQQSSNQHPTFRSGSSYLSSMDAVSSSPSNGPPPRKKKHYWSNIIPFDRNSNSSRSSITSETDRLLPLSRASYQTMSSSPVSRPAAQISSFEKAYKYIKHKTRSFFQANTETEKSTHIYFEGWSLCMFPPKSWVRLYLWKTVGSK
jgi:hypothetical protein